MSAMGLEPTTAKNGSVYGQSRRSLPSQSFRSGQQSSLLKPTSLHESSHDPSSSRGTDDMLLVLLLKYVPTASRLKVGPARASPPSTRATAKPFSICTKRCRW